MSERLISDIGGFAEGEVPLEERRQLFWEKQLIAVVNLLTVRLGITLDEFRRAVEEMPPEEYQKSYLYGRRLDGWLRLLIEYKVIDPVEHRRRTEEILSRGTRDYAR